MDNIKTLDNNFFLLIYYLYKNKSEKKLLIFKRNVIFFKNAKYRRERKNPSLSISVVLV